MKIEIEADELIQITKELNNAMFEKVRLIADGYEEQLKKEEEK